MIAGDANRRARWSVALFGVLLVLIALAYWPGLDLPGRAPRESLLLVGAPLLLGLALLGCRTFPSFLFLSAPAVALLSGVVHVVFAPGPERFAVARDLAVMAAPWCVALAAAVSTGERKRFDAALETAAMTTLLALGLLGLAQAWLGWDIFVQRNPPASTFVNRNVAAQSIVGLVPLVLPALFAGGSRWIRWAAALSGGVGVAFLVATRTRGAWVGTVTAAFVGGALWLVHHEKLRPARRAVAPLALAVGLGVVALFVPVIEGTGKLPSVPERLGDLMRPFQGTGVIRLALLQNSAAMALEGPFGVGPGRFTVVYPLYHDASRETPWFGTAYQPEHVHNDLLEYAVDLGIPATLALALLLVGAVVLCFQRPLAGSSPQDLYRHAARAAALTGILAHSLVSFPLHSPASAYIAWLLVGRCWSRTGHWRGPSRTTRILGVLVLATLPLAAWIGSREIQSQSLLREARRAHAAGDCARALGLTSEIPELAPWRRRDIGMAAMIRFHCTTDGEESLAALEHALALHPNRLELLLATGARRLKADQVRYAQAAFQHAVDIVPGHARAWLGLAMARLALSDGSGAEEACGRTLEFEEGLEPAQVFCGENRLIPEP